MGSFRQQSIEKRRDIHISNNSIALTKYCSMNNFVFFLREVEVDLLHRLAHRKKRCRATIVAKIASKVQMPKLQHAMNVPRFYGKNTTDLWLPLASIWEVCQPLRKSGGSYAILSKGNLLIRLPYRLCNEKTNLGQEHRVPVQRYWQIHLSKSLG